MAKRKNNTALWLIVGILFGALVFGGVWLLAGGATTLSVTPTVVSDYDGEFSGSELPQEIGGTDLVANTTYTESDEAFTVAYETNTDVNGTDGTLYYLAFGFEVSSGDMEDLEIEGELGSTIDTTEMVIRKAYIVEDVEGKNLDSQDQLAGFIYDVDTDQDKFTIEGTPLMDGEYVLVVEAKAISTSTIADGEELLSIEFDAESDDSDAVDSGTVTIYNSI